MSITITATSKLVAPVITKTSLGNLTRVSRRVGRLIDGTQAGGLHPRRFRKNAFAVSGLKVFNMGRFATVVGPPRSYVLTMKKARHHLIPSAGKRPVTTSVVSIAVDYSRQIISKTAKTR